MIYTVLNSAEICILFQANNIEVKLAQTSSKVQEAINRQCQCQIDTGIIDEESLSCFGLVDSVTYRARLGGTAEQNSTVLISLIEDWVATGPVIQVYGMLMRIDQNCTAVISDFSDNGCTSRDGTQNQSPADDGTVNQSDDNGLAIAKVVGSLFGSLVTVLSAAVTLVGIISGCHAWIKKKK